MDVQKNRISASAANAPSVVDLGADAKTAQAMKVLLYVKAEKKRLKDMEKAARAVVEKALGDNEEGWMNGRQTITWKRGTTKRFDTERFIKEWPQIYLLYMVENIPTRPFIPKLEGDEDDD